MLGRAEALAKIRWPALIMQIYGVMWLIVGPGCFIGSFFVTEQKEPDRSILIVVLWVGGCLSAAYGGFTVLAASWMKQLRSYGMALTSVILSFVVALLMCILLGVVGIWPLVVLLDPNVRGWFGSPFDDEAA